jgi:hypothetical protein
MLHLQRYLLAYQKLATLPCWCEVWTPLGIPENVLHNLCQRIADSISCFSIYYTGLEVDEQLVMLPLSSGVTTAPADPTSGGGGHSRGAAFWILGTKFDIEKPELAAAAEQNSIGAGGGK